MSGEAALARAHLGAALCDLPTELCAARTSSRCRSAGARAAAALASDLERASPGIALMAQLRGRFFDDALRAASRRGFDRLVTVGRGFASRRPRRCAGSVLLAVEHGAVVGAIRRGGADGVRYLVVDDLAAGACGALDACRVTALKTFVVLQGLSVWGGPDALATWLDYAARTAAGSELLLAVADATAAAWARRTAPDASVAAPPFVGFGADRAAVVGDAAARSLTVLLSCDSGDLQRRYVGADDLLVREGYVWMRNGSASRAGALLPSRPAGPLRMAATTRPVLRHPLRARSGGDAVLLTWPVTALRSGFFLCGRRERDIARLCDGTRTVAAIRAKIAESARDGIAASIRKLAAHGLLRRDDVPHEGLAVSGAASVAALAGTRNAIRTALARNPFALDLHRELAYAAIEARDPGAAREVADALAFAVDNPAADHLRRLLLRCGDPAAPRFARRDRVAVIAPGVDAGIDPGAVLDDVEAFLASIETLFGVRLDGSVLIDVTSPRAAFPLTVVADDAPYTLVTIPSPGYSRPLLCHELTHVVVAPGSRWLTEGLAVWTQRRMAPGRCYPDEVADDAGAATRVSLEERLCAVVGPLPDASLPALTRADYREAAAFVDFVVRTHGIEALRAFCGAVYLGIDGDGVREASRVLGAASPTELEREWRSETP